jgi:hypothetical protein
VAWGSSAVHNHSEFTTLELFAFSAAWLIAKCTKISRAGNNTTLITPKRGEGTGGWLEDEAVNEQSGRVVVFKRVSSDFKTQEGTENETLWLVGTTVTHHNYNPTGQECGPGKFHACSRGYFCDEFRSNSGDRYVAIEVMTNDLYAWPNAQHQHKIAFREGRVLHECNRYGKKL